MSKQTKAASELNEAQLEQVKSVIADMSNNTYSTSKIYAAHNEVFGLKEVPQSCASCLKKRATALRDWFNEQDQPKDATAKKGAKTAAPAKDTKPGAKGVNDANTIAGGLDSTQTNSGPVLEATNVKTKSGEDLAVNIQRDADGNYLGIADAFGDALKPGTYALENGDSIAVQPGGKSNYKPNEDLT